MKCTQTGELLISTHRVDIRKQYCNRRCKSDNKIEKNSEMHPGLNGATHGTHTELNLAHKPEVGRGKFGNEFRNRRYDFNADILLLDSSLAKFELHTIRLDLNFRVSEATTFSHISL
jgi:hypothetical protein